MCALGRGGWGRGELLGEDCAVVEFVGHDDGDGGDGTGFGAVAAGAVGVHAHYVGHGEGEGGGVCVLVCWIFGRWMDGWIFTLLYGFADEG